MFKPILSGKLIFFFFFLKSLFWFNIFVLISIYGTGSVLKIMVCFVFESLTLYHYSLLLLKIVHISKDDKDRWYIFVWDGTEMPPCNIVVK